MPRLEEAVKMFSGKLGGSVAVLSWSTSWRSWQKNGNCLTNVVPSGIYIAAAKAHCSHVSDGTDFPQTVLTSSTFLHVDTWGRTIPLGQTIPTGDNRDFDTPGIVVNVIRLSQAGGKQYSLFSSRFVSNKRVLIPNECKQLISANAVAELKKWH